MERVHRRPVLHGAQPNRGGPGHSDGFLHAQPAEGGESGLGSAVLRSRDEDVRRERAVRERRRRVRRDLLVYSGPAALAGANGRRRSARADHGDLRGPRGGAFDGHAGRARALPAVSALLAPSLLYLPKSPRNPRRTP